MVQFDFSEQTFDSNKFTESDILSVGTDTSKKTGSRGQVVTGIKDSKGRDAVAVKCDDKWKQITLRSSQEIKKLEDRLKALEKKVAIIKANNDRPELRTTVKMDIFTQTTSGSSRYGLISYMWDNGSPHTNTPYTVPSYFVEEKYVCGIMAWLPTVGTYSYSWSNVHDKQYDGSTPKVRGCGFGAVAFDTHTPAHHSVPSTYDNYIEFFAVPYTSGTTNWQTNRPVRGIFITKK